MSTKRLKSKVLIFAILLLSLMATMARAAAFGSSYLVLSDETPKVYTGQTLTFSISADINSQESFTRAQLRLQYPAETLKYLGQQATNSTVSCPLSSASNNQVIISCSANGPQTGSIKIDQVNFEVLTGGSATVTTNNSGLYDGSDRNIINGVYPSIKAPLSGTAPAANGSSTATPISSIGLTPTSTVSSSNPIKPLADRKPAKTRPLKVDVQIINENRKPVNKVRIKFNGQTGFSNNQGFGYFTYTQAGNYLITAQKGRLSGSVIVSLSGKGANVVMTLKPFKPFYYILAGAATGTLLIVLIILLIKSRRKKRTEISFL